MNNLFYRTPYNQEKFVKQREVNNMPSVTVPDMSLSVKQIMDRYAKGLPLEGVRVPIYEGEEFETPDMSKLDLSERYELIQENRERIMQIQKNLTQNEKDKERKELEQLQLDLEEREEKKQKPPKPTKPEKPKELNAGDE